MKTFHFHYRSVSNRNGMPFISNSHLFSALFLFQSGRMKVVYCNDAGEAVTLEVHEGTTAFGTRKPIAFKSGFFFEPIKHKNITVQKQFQFVITDSSIQVANFGQTVMKVDHSEGTNDLEKGKALTVGLQTLQLTIGSFIMKFYVGDEVEQQEEVQEGQEEQGEDNNEEVKEDEGKEEPEKVEEKEEEENNKTNDKEDIKPETKEEEKENENKKEEIEEKALEIKKPTIKKIAAPKKQETTKDNNEEETTSKKATPAKRASKTAEPKPKKETKEKTKKQTPRKKKNDGIVNDDEINEEEMARKIIEENSDDSDAPLIDDEPENPEEVARIEKELAEEEEADESNPEEEDEDNEDNQVIEANGVDDVIKNRRSKKKFYCYLSGFNENEESALENKIESLKGEVDRAIIIYLDPVWTKSPNKKNKSATTTTTKPKSDEKTGENMNEEEEEEETEVLTIPPFVESPSFLIVHTPLKITTKLLFCVAADVPIFYKRMLDDSIKKMKMPDLESLASDSRRINELNWDSIPKYLRRELKSRGLKDKTVKLFKHRLDASLLRDRRVIVSVKALSTVTAKTGKRKLEEAETKMLETAVILASMFKEVVLYDGTGRCNSGIPRLPKGFGEIRRLKKEEELQKGDILIASEDERKNEFQQYKSNKDILHVTKDFVVAMVLLGDSSMEYFKIEEEEENNDENENKENSTEENK